MQFDPDHWLRLARDDPEGFERSRLEAIESLIASAPAELRDRLRGLQFRIDMALRRSSSPLGGALRVQQMMWDSFADLRRALQDLVDARDEEKGAIGSGASGDGPTSAAIIPFPRQR